MTVDGQLIATGGLCNTVSIYQKHPELEKFKPWIALLYTTEEYRNKGYGQKLLEFIEKGAKTMKFNTVYLYTYTAEPFYKRCGWTELKRVYYKDHETVVMREKV